MKIYKTQSEVEKDIKNRVLKIDDDVTFECSISIDASIYAHNIKANNINALDINAYNIDADDIDALNIYAEDIDAGDIDALNIDANNINAYNIDANDINALNIYAEDIDAYNIDADDINADNINALNIDAGNISYYAFCFSYNSIKCYSIEARREKHSEPICLDGKLEIKEQEDNVALEAIKILEEKGYKIIKK